MDGHVCLVDEIMELPEFATEYVVLKNSWSELTAVDQQLFQGRVVLHNTGVNNDGYSWAGGLVLSPRQKLVHQLTEDLGA